jgi:hypothetical protein
VYLDLLNDHTRARKNSLTSNDSESIIPTSTRSSSSTQEIKFQATYDRMTKRLDAEISAKTVLRRMKGELEEELAQAQKKIETYEANISVERRRASEAEAQRQMLEERNNSLQEVVDETRHQIVQLQQELGEMKEKNQELRKDLERSPRTKASPRVMSRNSPASSHSSSSNSRSEGGGGGGGGQKYRTSSTAAAKTATASGKLASSAAVSFHRIEQEIADSAELLRGERAKWKKSYQELNERLTTCEKQRREAVRSLQVSERKHAAALEAMQREHAIAQDRSVQVLHGLERRLQGSESQCESLESQCARLLKEFKLAANDPAVSQHYWHRLRQEEDRAFHRRSIEKVLSHKVANDAAALEAAMLQKVADIREKSEKFDKLAGELEECERELRVEEKSTEGMRTSLMRMHAENCVLRREVEFERLVYQQMITFLQSEIEAWLAAGGSASTSLPSAATSRHTGNSSNSNNLLEQLDAKMEQCWAEWRVERTVALREFAAANLSVEEATDRIKAMEEEHGEVNGALALKKEQLQALEVESTQQRQVMQEELREWSELLQQRQLQVKEAEEACERLSQQAQQSKESAREAEAKCLSLKKEIETRQTEWQQAHLAEQEGARLLHESMEQLSREVEQLQAQKESLLAEIAEGREECSTLQHAKASLDSTTVSLQEYSQQLQEKVEEKKKYFDDLDKMLDMKLRAREEQYSIIAQRLEVGANPTSTPPHQQPLPGLTHTPPYLPGSGSVPSNLAMLQQAMSANGNARSSANANATRNANAYANATGNGTTAAHLSSHPSFGAVQTSVTAGRGAVAAFLGKMAGSGRPLSGEEKRIFEEQSKIIGALFSKARHNKVDAVEHLLQNGVPADTVDQYGNCLLHIAGQNGRFRIAKLALDFGCSPNIQNNQGQTPLHFCNQYNYLKLGSYLISRGADISIKNAAGLTPLEGISEKDRFDLTANAANPNIGEMRSRNASMEMDEKLTEVEPQVDEANRRLSLPADSTILRRHRASLEPPGQSGQNAQVSPSSNFHSEDVDAADEAASVVSAHSEASSSVSTKRSKTPVPLLQLEGITD